MNDNDKMLTDAEVSERWRGRVSRKTLANWRHLGQGPSYVKVGGRPMYPLKYIIEWEARRTIGDAAAKARACSQGDCARCLDARLCQCKKKRA